MCRVNRTQRLTRGECNELSALMRVPTEYITATEPNQGDHKPDRFFLYPARDLLFGAIRKGPRLEVPRDLNERAMRRQTPALRLLALQLRPKLKSQDRFLGPLPQSYLQKFELNVTWFITRAMCSRTSQRFASLRMFTGSELGAECYVRRAFNLNTRLDDVHASLA